MASMFVLSFLPISLTSMLKTFFSVSLMWKTNRINYYFFAGILTGSGSGDQNFSEVYSGSGLYN